MIGIKSYGAYIPKYRLNRDEIATGLGMRSTGGENAIANFDEDSLTLSIEAINDCLRGADATPVGGLFLASTTFPYKEKQSASIAAFVTDLPQKILSSDFSNSIRCGSIALRCAIDSVKAGSAESIIVSATDTRMGDPETELIQMFGDGAAAFIISNKDPVVSIERSLSWTNEFTDFWRKKDDIFVHSHDPAFMRQYGCVKGMTDTIESLLRESGFGKDEFAKIVYNAYDQRSHQEIAKRLGFDLSKQVQNPLYQDIGNTGCASALMALVAALQDSKENDLILFANYGDGCDAFILKVQAGIESVNRSVRGIYGWMKEREEMKFHQYLKFRNLITKEI